MLELTNIRNKIQKFLLSFKEHIKFSCGKISIENKYKYRIIHITYKLFFLYLIKIYFHFYGFLQNQIHSLKHIFSYIVLIYAYKKLIFTHSDKNTIIKKSLMNNARNYICDSIRIRYNININEDDIKLKNNVRLENNNLKNLISFPFFIDNLIYSNRLITILFIIIIKISSNLLKIKEKKGEIQEIKMERKKPDSNIAKKECKNIKRIKTYKKGNNIKEKTIFSRTNMHIIMKILILMNQFIQISQFKGINFLKSNVNKITLNIKGKGIKNVFSTDETYYFESDYFPNSVYINGRLKSVQSTYNFIDEDNFVELIWNRKIKKTRYMFYRCSDITKIDLSKFDSSEVVDISSMFYCCSSLTSLDLSNFDTLRVSEMDQVFRGCSSLTSLNLSSFKTSNVIDMNYLFYNCTLLISLDLSNFDTSKVHQFYGMFYNCISLSSLNLSNFKCTQMWGMGYMFEDCVNLEYINLKNCETTNTWDYNIFKNVPDNIVACLNEENSNIRAQIQEKSCYTFDCSDNWRENQKKLINEKGECENNCEDNSLYKNEYNGKCYEDCPSGINLLEDNIITNECKCELEKCLTCPQVALNFKLCTKCNMNYYPIENDPENLGEYINYNCYNEISKGYFLEQDASLYRKCYKTCEACEKEGNDVSHNCIKCNENYTFIMNINNYLNCYEKCEYNYYLDKDNYTYCTIDSTCPEEYPTLLSEKKECIYREYTTQIIKEEPTTQIIKEEYTTQTIKEEPTTQIMKEEYTTQIMKEEYTTQIIKEEYTTQIIKEEPTT